MLTVRHSLWAAGLFGLAALFVYAETVMSMVAIWSRSDTFAHGFLILPISLWLIWTHRESLVPIKPAPAPVVALLLLPGIAAWTLAVLVDVLVIQQLALVGLLVVGSWAILGHRLTAALAFPLGFLFFAVPMGEGLVEPMMEFTAATTVWLVRATGIPVYREGLYFTLPTGQWSVVEACSGVRYIIASVTVGALYAYLTYVSWWRRGVFFIVSAIVPIFANTVRAYIIVMLGHMSGMQVATGADHLVYGWVFFGLVVFLLFWLGSFFREDLPEVDANPVAGEAEAGSQTSLVVTTVLVLGVILLGPLSAARLSPDAAGWPDQPRLPPPAEGWRDNDGRDFFWQPAAKVGGVATATYIREGVPVRVLVQYADGQFDLGEVVGSNRFFVWGDRVVWQLVARDTIVAPQEGPSYLIEEANVRGPRGEFIAWSWYQIGREPTSNDYVAKLQQLSSTLGIQQSGTWRVLVLMPVWLDGLDRRRHFEAFLSAHGTAIRQALLEAALGDGQ